MSEKDLGADAAAVATAEPVASPQLTHVAPHTPGPWMSFDSGTMILSNDSDTLIASLDESEIETIAEREANAHLIAAAPELLEFAKAVRADASAYPWHLAADKVISKATGRES